MVKGYLMDDTLRCYTAEVQEVHSGDDLVLMVNIGIDSLYKRVRARLQGVDTPDAYKAAADTEAGIVRDRVRKLIKGKKCTIKVHSFSPGKGGWKVTLYIGQDTNTETLNEILQQEGYVFKGNHDAA